jgi:hypothetical protein
MSVNYLLTNGFYIFGGFALSSVNNVSDLNCKLTGSGFQENYDYGFTQKLSYIYPYIGVAKRFNDFYVYANIGLNLVKYDYEMTKEFVDGSYWEKEKENINVSEKIFSAVFGLKYKRRIYGKIKGFIKLEYKYSNLSSVNADYTLSGSNSEGNTISKNYSGTIYSYELDPYNASVIKTWGVFDDLPTSAWTDNFEKLMLKLSAVKISIGLSF